MALRVLLADESTTIKKVMQLALQDFAVEVKSVQSGIDVLEVAKSFQPDIIFADVLLQKKNGYEVCGDLKTNADSQQIPVVLMWSSFMDLDEQQAQNCRADRRLEKPFDVENLRQIILELVPKTRSQRLAHFLKFPETVTEPLAAEEHAKSQKSLPPKAAVAPKAPPPPPVPAAPTEPPPTTHPAWNMENFEDIGQFAEVVEREGHGDFEEAPPQPKPNPPSEEAGDDSLYVDLPPLDEGEEFEVKPIDDDFHEVRLAKKPGAAGPLPSPRTENPPELDLDANDLDATDGADDEAWSHQNLSRFKLDVASLEDEDVKLDLEEVTAPESLEHGDFLRHPETAPALTDFNEPTYHLPVDTDETAAIGLTGQLSADRLEQIVRAQSREIIETVVRRIARDVIPDLATKIIREELDRLLEDSPRESSP